MYELFYKNRINFDMEIEYKNKMIYSLYLNILKKKHFLVLNLGFKYFYLYKIDSHFYRFLMANQTFFIFLALELDTFLK